MKEEDNSENKAKARLEGGSSLSAFDLMVPKANSLEFVVDADTLQPKETGAKRTRTSSLDSDTWGSASEYSLGHAHGRRRLSESGLDFRLMSRKAERLQSDEDDETSAAEENWDSDNATADENSEMFEDDLNGVDWSGDEAENDLQTGDEGTRTDSALSQEIGIVSPFTPITKPETEAQTTLRRRRAARKMDREINDTLSSKVRKLGNGDGEDSLIEGLNNKTPFKRGSDSVTGYFSETSSSSRSSSRTAQSQYWKDRFNSPRLAGDVPSDAFASEDGEWN